MHSDKVNGEPRAMRTSSRKNWLKVALCGLSVAGAVSATGCQVHVAGQTLPSPYYMPDDVQYFAPGPEFKLTREAAAQKAYKSEQEALR